MSTHTGANRPPQLILRFAVYSAAALLLAGAGILWYARHAAEQRSEREALERTQSTAMLVSDRLQPSDFAGPVGKARQAELDRLFAPLLDKEFVRIKLWTRDGFVTYSDDGTLIGASDPQDKAIEAIAGGPATEVGRLNDEGGSGENIKVLSAYVPVRIGGSSQPVGALELYKNFDEVSADAMATVKPVAAALTLALLLLYASLFPMLRQVTGALEARTRRLQQQSNELETMIAERRQALTSLREADARYLALLEELPLVTYVSSTDLAAPSAYVSPQLEPLLGYTPEEWIATPGLFWQVIHPDDAERVREEHEAGFAKADTFSTHYRLRAKDGREIWVEDQVRVIHDAEGLPVQAQGFLIDITARKLSDDERLKLAGIVESSDDAITSANLDGIVTSWNKGAERMFGYTAEEMVGRPGTILVPEGESSDPMARIASVVETGEGRFEATRRRKDGSLIDISVTMSAVRNAAGKVVAVAAISHDITDRKRVEQEREEFTRELEIRNERLLELDRLKDEFVALVSHELRTPLTSIRGYLELVMDGEAGPVTDDQRQFLGVVERNANRLLDLVGDLLFLAQIEAGKLSLEVGAVDLAALAAESVETARPLAEEKGVTLTLATSPLPLLAGDRARLAQLLDNLVSNAIKFTPEGGRVDVRASASNGNAILEVRDTGMGIAAEEQEHIFERFFRTSRATEQAIQGTGLGLAISKAIVHAHGGAITLASSEGEGATFKVAIPIRAAAPAPMAAEQEEIAS